LAIRGRFLLSGAVIGYSQSIFTFQLGHWLLAGDFHVPTRLLAVAVDLHSPARSLAARGRFSLSGSVIGYLPSIFTLRIGHWLLSVDFHFPAQSLAARGRTSLSNSVIGYSRAIFTLQLGHWLLAGNLHFPDRSLATRG